MKILNLCCFVLFCLLMSCNKRPSTDEKNKDEKAGIARSTSNELKKEGARQANVKTEDLPVIAFEKSTFDFGTIKEGEIVKHTFRFKNTGKTPLLIQNATASCGCTVPDWPKDPIAPNQEGKIIVEFNSSGKSGMQNKTVTILANTDPPTNTLELKGMIRSVSDMKGPLNQ